MAIGAFMRCCNAKVSGCNRKTVYQYLKRKAWLASHRRRTLRPGRRHEGKVAMLRSNQRWAFDITNLPL